MPLPSDLELVTLEGRNVKLRALVPSDAEAVFSLYRDKREHRFGFQPKMDTIDDAHALITRTRELATAKTIWHWGVADRLTNVVLGHATLFALHVESQRAELGYSIAPSLRGRGLASDAVSTLVGHAFERLELRRLEADVDPRNAPSIRLLERLGFSREGLLRERWLLGGELQDALLYGLLARDWRGR